MRHKCKKNSFFLSEIESVVPKNIQADTFNKVHDTGLKCGIASATISRFGQVNVLCMVPPLSLSMVSFHDELCGIIALVRFCTYVLLILLKRRIF